jgi:hypothetical protein
MGNKKFNVCYYYISSDDPLNNGGGPTKPYIFLCYKIHQEVTLDQFDISLTGLS